MTITGYPSALTAYAAPVGGRNNESDLAVNTTASGNSQQPRSAGPSSLTRLTDALLSVLAAAGIMCIIAVICAFTFNITFIMFKTGSMSPTIPAGSLAVVREVPAEDIQIGDVTTIDRPGQLPVTHRVIAIEPAQGTASGAMTIRMKGDANAEEDPLPYTATEVRKVLWHVDDVGPWVAKAQNPKIMAVTTVVMALLVTWAFWPRKRDDR